MPAKSRSILKRQKERARQERQQVKLDKRTQRNAERREQPAPAAESPDFTENVTVEEPPSRTDE